MEPVNDQFCRIFTCLRHKQGKFIAAQAGKYIGGPDLLADAVCYRAQDPVANAVAEAVVDGFEVIQVNISKREGRW